MSKTAGPFLQDTYPISQHFGENQYFYSDFGLYGHDGIDIATPLETTVMAGVNGVVSAVGNDPNGYGKYVRVYDHSQNLLIIYAHLNSVAPLIQQGARVVPQNPIGGTGNTGRSTGPHLHLGFADTDSGGGKLNRENGFDGWKNPEDKSWFNLKLFASNSSAGAGTPPPTETTAPEKKLPAGVTPPPYSPTFAGQAVSIGGNFFQSDDGKIWIFKGTDKQRAAGAEAEKKKEAHDTLLYAQDSGVYLQKANLLQKFGIGTDSPSNYGLRDAENLVIKGPYIATLSPGRGGAGNPPTRVSKPGTYPINWNLDSITVEAEPAPPAPEPLPNIPVTETTTAGDGTLTAGDGSATPGQQPATAPWSGKKAPTHKEIYNKLVELFRFILS